MSLLDIKHMYIIIHLQVMEWTSISESLQIEPKEEQVFRYIVKLFETSQNIF